MSASSARGALTRQLLLCALLVAATVAVVLAAVLGLVAWTSVDRPAFLLGALAAGATWRSGRTLWRVRRDGVGAALPAPPEPLEPAPRGELDAEERFWIAQRFRLVGDRYELATLADDERSPDRPVAAVDRAAFAARERLEAYGPGQRLVFAVRALQILDVAGRYRVDDPAGERIGELRKIFTASLVRSTWEVYDGAGTLTATAQERSLPVALLRRAIDLLPFVGDVLALLPIPYHFDLRAPDGSPVGTVRRLRTVRDRYALELPGDPERRIDRRLALALAVALDALQGR